MERTKEQMAADEERISATLQAAIKPVLVDMDQCDIGALSAVAVFAEGEKLYGLRITELVTEEDYREFMPEDMVEALFSGEEEE